MPFGANSASVGFPIPCLPSLVSAIFETQWTTLDFAQTPCGLLPPVSPCRIARRS
jgi:hypothetical protein